VTFLLDQDVPDDVQFSLSALGHTVLKLRDVLPITASDRDVLRTATERECVLITCNRDDFLALAQTNDHAGLIVLIRRRSRAQERAALVHLLDTAGESGLRGNINFA
jgi:predicted nuclease of predicted toxin-antitoxin system